MKGLKRYTKSTLTYGEAYELNKRRKAEEEARKKSLENNCSHDEGFDVTLGAMVGALMSDNYDNSDCDISTDCDISGSFD
jgi:hypothetical protein